MDEHWITLTDEDVMPAASQERKSIAAVKGVDDLAAKVQQATGQVRDAYRSGGRLLGDHGTIPAGLKDRAVAIALWRFLVDGVARNDSVHTREREHAYDEAVKYLEAIARREIKGTGSAQIVSGNKRQATREKLSGL